MALLRIQSCITRHMMFAVVDRGSSDGDGISDADKEGRVEGSAEPLDGSKEQKARQPVLDQRDAE